jgi:hypothetical protein
MPGERRIWLRFPPLAAFAAIVVGLFVPSHAEARKGMFRVQREFLGIFGAPSGPSGTAHRICAAGTTAGKQCAFEPPTTGGTAVCGAKSCPPATLSYTNVGFGASFMLPKSFLDVSLTRSCFGTHLPLLPCGYTGYQYGGVYDYVNGPGHFQKVNPYGASTTTLVVFPTTMGNPAPNEGSGFPVTPTTTFSGRYDNSRAGSIVVVPGPNRFGGTLRMLQGANSSRFGLNYLSSPIVYRYYGTPTCQMGGVACTSQQPSVIGQTTVGLKGTRFATISGSKLTDGSGNYLSWPVYSLSQLAPWTTGALYGVVPFQAYAFSQEATYAGYDKRKLVTTSGPAKVQYQVGVMSLVRARLVHEYRGAGFGSPPLHYSSVLRMERIKLHFLPEPDATVLICAGIATLAALGWTRRRR